MLDTSTRQGERLAASARLARIMQRQANNSLAVRLASRVALRLALPMWSELSG